MKTTLEIPDQTFRKAKAAASALGIPLCEFVTQAVEEKLASAGHRRDKPWLECAGELAHLHKETARIQKIIDEECEQIEPEDRTLFSTRMLFPPILTEARKLSIS